MPVQRWFPYREGYSVRLVNAFINELNITGNTFDPFAGSGTTLLASRTNDISSFGIDVNPISVLVAKVENEQYNKKDLKSFEKEIENIRNLGESPKEYQTPFELAYKVFNQEILQSLLQFKHHIKKLEVILTDLKLNYGKCEKKPTVFNGSCLEFNRFLMMKLS